MCVFKYHYYINLFCIGILTFAAVVARSSSCPSGSILSERGGVRPHSMVSSSSSSSSDDHQEMVPPLMAGVDVGAALSLRCLSCSAVCKENGYIGQKICNPPMDA